MGNRIVPSTSVWNCYMRALPRSWCGAPTSASVRGYHPKAMGRLLRSQLAAEPLGESDWSDHGEGRVPGAGRPVELVQHVVEVTFSD